MKLSGPMRAQVVVKALQHTFAKRWKDLLKEGEALGDATIDTLAGTAKAAIKKADEAGFCMRAQKVADSYLKMEGGSTHYMRNVEATVAGQRFNIMVTPNKAIPVRQNRDGYQQTPVVLNHTKEGHTPHIEALQAWQNKGEQFTKDYAQAKATLEAMLKGLSTFAKLEEQWPEGKKFYQSLPVDFPFQHNVPAVQIKELNAMLGIAA